MMWVFILVTLPYFYGIQIKQSNCRVIRWSNGSQTLLLGKEQFEVVKSLDASSTAQASPSKDSKSAPRTQGQTYLVAQHARSTILQAEAPDARTRGRSET